MKTHIRIARLPVMGSMLVVLCCSPGWAWQGEEAAVSDGAAGKQASIRKRQSSKFLRVQTDEYREPTALQTATTRYILKDDEGKTQLEVFLEGIVHIADASYYRAFTKRLRHYDCVLFEMVRPPGTEVSQEPEAKDEKKSGGAGLLRMFQQLSASSVGLSYQTEELNYDVDTFVHSDLSPAEIAERLAERGEDGVTMLSDLLMQLTRQMTSGSKEAVEDEPSDQVVERLDLSILTDANGTTKIRRLLATHLGESDLSSALPSSLHRILIVDRNDRAMEVFQEELDKGKRRIAFLWGAGHMADFERRLVLEYGMEKAEVNWRNAWDLREGAVDGAPLEGLLDSVFRDSFKENLRKLIQDGAKKDDR